MILSKWEIVNREMEVPSFYFKLAEVEALTLVSPFERQGFPPAGKSLPVLTTLSSRFSRGTMPALFREKNNKKKAIFSQKSGKKNQVN